MALPAATTRSVSGSSSLAAASLLTTGGLASFMSGAHLLFVLPYDCRYRPV
jgi:hypothetical protein